MTLIERLKQFKIPDVPERPILYFCQGFIYLCAALLVAVFGCLMFSIGNVINVMGGWPYIGMAALWLVVGVVGLVLAVAVIVLLIVGVAWAALTVNNFYLDWKERRERREAQKLR